VTIVNANATKSGRIIAICVYHDLRLIGRVSDKLTGVWLGQEEMQSLGYPTQGFSLGTECQGVLIQPKSRLATLSILRKRHEVIS
jgi:hypothetical protein